MRPRNLEKEEAIRSIALDIIATEGLENLSMQKLAKAANISPRTIYIKYKSKEDFLVKLFIREVFGPYEKALMEGFEENMDFAEGIQLIWKNAFRFLVKNKPYYVLMQYGKSSPLLNKAFQEENIKQGHFFSPVHRFLDAHADAGLIPHYPIEVYRALLFAPMLDLVNEFFEYEDRPQQIITPELMQTICETVIRGLMNHHQKSN